MQVSSATHRAERVLRHERAELQKDIKVDYVINLEASVDYEYSNYLPKVQK